MITLYLAEMKALSNTDPDIYVEFKDGIWVVNKNPCVDFSAVGPDNALEPTLFLCKHFLLFH